MQVDLARTLASQISKTADSAQKVLTSWKTRASAGDFSLAAMLTCDRHKPV
jgi:hypothetical protein